MKHNKFVIILLLLAMLFSSCGGSDVETETKLDTEPTVSTETESETVLMDAVPELDFGGATFAVLTGIHGTYPVDCYSAEQSGDAMDDILYQRNLYLEERFSVVFEETVTANIVSDVPSQVRSAVLAGDDVWKMAMMVDRFALNVGMEGCLYSYSDLPYIDLSNSWWNQNAKEDFTIDGKLFFTYGDDNLIFFLSTTVLAFNKQMVLDYGLDDPYTLVYDGKWTYDRFMEMNHTVTQDVNGDGKMTIADQFGTVFGANMFYANFWLQDGMKLVEKDDEDLPYFNVPGNEQLITLLVKLATDAKDTAFYDVQKQSDYKAQYDQKTGNNYNDIMAIFADDKALFASSSLINIMDARSMETDFGILPFPASEEKEAGYIYGSRTFGGFPYVVPVTVQDTEMVSAIMEASACESMKSVIPVVYDKVLKGKNTRDTDSEAILDMIRQNRITDLAEVYWWDNIECKYEVAMRDGNINIASFTESIRKMAESDITKGVEFFTALD